MRQILTTIVLAVTTLIPGVAADDYISTHQSWVDREFANPAKMDKQKLVELSIQIIGNNLQEEKALNVVRETAKFVPELEDYCRWRPTGATDSLMMHTILPIKHLADYAAREWPGTHFATSCMTTAYIGAGNVLDMSKQWERLISDFSETAAKEPTAENKAQLALMKIIAFCQKTIWQGYDDPTEYSLMFDLEQDALDAFPPDSDDNSMLRADLYFWLGQMKVLPSDGYMAGVEASLHPDLLKMDYLPTLDGCLYPNNAQYYFKKAYEIAAANLNEGHPYVREIGRQELGFRLNNFHAGDNVYDELRDDFNYIRSYFQRNSVEVAVNRILFALYTLQSGRVSPDEALMKSSVETLEAILGIANPIYMQHLFQIASSYLFIDETNDYWYNLVTDTLEAVHGEDITDTEFRMMIRMFSAYYAINTEQALDRIKILYEEYMESHEPTMSSILCGRDLAQFYATQLFDRQTAFSLLFIAKADLQEMLGEKYFDEPFSWVIELQLSENMAEALKSEGASDELMDNSYRMSINQLNTAKPRGCDYLEYLFRMARADFRQNVMKDYQGASEEIAKAIEKASTTDDKARTHALMAMMLQKSGDREAEADSHHRLAVEFIESVQHELINQTTYELAGSYLYNQGEFEASLRIQERQLEAYRKLMGDAFSMEYVNIRRGMAETYECLGRRNEARLILDEDSDRIAEAFGLTPTPALLDNLWMDYFFTRNDNVFDMIALFPKLMRITEVTGALLKSSNYADTYFYTYLVRVQSETLWLMSVNYSNIPDMSAATAEDIKKFEDGKAACAAIYSQLEEMRAGFQNYDPDYSNNADYRGIVNAMLNYQNLIVDNHEETRRLYDELTAGEINENTISNHIDYAWYCFNLADFHSASQIIAKLSGKLPSILITNDNIIDNFENLCQLIHMRSGDYDKALSYARSLYARNKKILDGNFQLMTTRDQENYMNTNGDPASPLTALMEYMPERLSAEVYDAIIYRTGMQLRSQRETREVLSSSNDPQVRLMLDSVRTLQASLTNIPPYNPMMTVQESNERSLRIANINHRINRLEQQLLTSTASLRQGTIADVHWEEIRDRLSNGEAAVEFIFSDSKIMALVLKPEIAMPRAVTLCDSELLPGLIGLNDKKNSASLAKSLYESPENAANLYRMLWQPLEAEIGSAQTVYYTAPGILSNLAFNAFQTPGGSYLFDRYNLVQLTTTAQLVFDTPGETPDHISMMGDILYDKTQQPLAIDAPGVRDIDLDFDFGDCDDNETADRAISKRNFRHLPFTSVELDGIAGTFPAAGVDSARRHNATELRLREMVTAHPQVLHLATHGYYISPSKDVSRHPFFVKKGSGTMQRSGIALAGAERTWRGLSEADDDTDGIVTASEVAALDLRGTQLVTLSACETALGDYSFEGIFGLQRGFKQAGAQSLLVSLWSVNDMSTSLFMTTFYSNLRGGQSRQKAWRGAVETVRAKYDSPYYWAPFILLDGQ